MGHRGMAVKATETQTVTNKWYKIRMFFYGEDIVQIHDAKNHVHAFLDCDSMLPFALFHFRKAVQKGRNWNLIVAKNS